MMSPPVLEIRDLVTSFRSPAGRWLSAVDGVSLRIPASTTIGVVGESGCGKSVTAMSILRLIREPGRISAGQILYRPQREGAAEVDLLALPEIRAELDIEGGATPLTVVSDVGGVAGIERRIEGGNELVRSMAVADAEQLLEWRDGLLFFHNTSLRDAVAEFNRYNTRKIVVADARAAELRVGGHFRWDNVDAFVRLLERGFPVRAEIDDRRIVLRSP